MSKPIPDADVALEASYLALVMHAPIGEHLDADGRVEPQHMFFDMHAALLRAIHAEWARARMRKCHEVARALDARGQGELALVCRSLTAEKITMYGADIVADRLRFLAERRARREHIVRLMSAHDESRDDDITRLAADLAKGEKQQDGVERVAAHDVAERAVTNFIHAPDRRKNRSGYHSVDSAIGGMPPATLMVLGGTTGSGKSSVALGMAMNACTHGRRPAFISLEDSEDVCGPRVLSHLCDVNTESFYGADVPRNFFDEASKGIEAAKKIGLEFFFPLNRPLKDVVACVRRAVKQFGCDSVFVDYLQAVKVDPRMPRHIAIADAAQTLKAECQALRVPLILMSQLRRPESGKTFAEPYATSLKESGDIENMAEIILLLWKENDDDSGRTLGKVAKIKWSPKRPRFVVERSPSTGCVTALIHREAPPAGSGRHLPEEN